MINAIDANSTYYLLNKKNKTPIVFIHGVGLNHSIWSPQINYFDHTKYKIDLYQLDL